VIFQRRYAAQVNYQFLRSPANKAVENSRLFVAVDKSRLKISGGVHQFCAMLEI
jgi:hypothetical protein